MVILIAQKQILALRLTQEGRGEEGRERGGVLRHNKVKGDAATQLQVSSRMYDGGWESLTADWSPLFASRCLCD